jgi:hypothetical protein
MDGEWWITLMLTAGLGGCSNGDRASRVDPIAQAAPETHARNPHANESHARGAHDAAAVTPPEGTLWPTDEPLRAGMARIESAVKSAGVMRPLSRERADKLAPTVEENVTYIVKNCKLPAEPDAALHVLIGRLMTATGELASDSTSDAALDRLAAVLRDYHRTFDDAPAAAATP